MGQKPNKKGSGRLPLYRVLQLYFCLSGLKAVISWLRRTEQRSKTRSPLHPPGRCCRGFIVADLIIGTSADTWCHVQYCPSGDTSEMWQIMGRRHIFLYKIKGGFVHVSSHLRTLMPSSYSDLSRHVSPLSGRPSLFFLAWHRGTGSVTSSLKFVSLGGRSRMSANMI